MFTAQVKVERHQLSEAWHSHISWRAVNPSVRSESGPSFQCKIYGRVCFYNAKRPNLIQQSCCHNPTTTALPDHHNPTITTPRSTPNSIPALISFSEGVSQNRNRARVPSLGQLSNLISTKSKHPVPDSISDTQQCPPRSAHAATRVLPTARSSRSSITTSDAQSIHI